jgi:hypothetical protein
VTGPQVELIKLMLAENLYFSDLARGRSAATSSPKAVEPGVLELVDAMSRAERLEASLAADALRTGAWRDVPADRDPLATLTKEERSGLLSFAASLGFGEKH